MAKSHRSTVRPEVLDVLGRLRGRIRRYVALEGTAIVLVVVGAAFWVSLAIDYWFELTSPARAFLLAVVMAGVAVAFVWYFALRVLRGLRHRGLALVLERHFPQLNDRLITAVELSDSPGERSELTAAMFRQTSDEAAE